VRRRYRGNDWQVVRIYWGKTLLPREGIDIENLVAKVLKLGDLVNYQAGSVVSRTLINRETGTITLFAFAEGQELSEHTAPYTALVQILDGEAIISIAGTPLRLQAGEGVIMPANKPHSVKAVTDFKMLLTMIRS
jgi:quercetin dioxygenase-like cupin family protein